MDESILHRSSVRRVSEALRRSGAEAPIRVLDESTRSAAEAASALGVEVGQIASSLVFCLPEGLPLLVITSGRHRVDTDLVARTLGVAELRRADADYVKAWSGFAIGGVSPVGWTSSNSTGVTPLGFPLEVTVLIDETLDEYPEVWAAAGHPHAVFPTTFAALCRATGARVVRVADE